MEEVAERTSRNRARRNVVGQSPNRDEYVRLMKAGWSSASLERYAAWRCNEDIPASTFRQYKKRLGLDVQTSRLLSQSFDTDAIPDVLTKRQELIAMQTERLAIDLKHERDMNKLFGTTKAEISVLNALLNDLRQDLIDVGMFGEGAAQPTPQEGAPDKRTLGDVLSGDPAQMAKVLHLLMPPAVVKEA